MDTSWTLHSMKSLYATPPPTEHCLFYIIRNVDRLEVEWSRHDHVITSWYPHVHHVIASARIWWLTQSATSSHFDPLEEGWNEFRGFSSWNISFQCKFQLIWFIPFNTRTCVDHFDIHFIEKHVFLADKCESKGVLRRKRATQFYKAACKSIEIR